MPIPRNTSRDGMNFDSGAAAYAENISYSALAMSGVTTFPNTPSCVQPSVSATSIFCNAAAAA